MKEIVLPVTTYVGFVVLTIVMYTLVLGKVKTTISLASWSATRKQKVYNTVMYAIAGWAIIISILAYAGVLSNFSSFPPRFIIVLVVPFITILSITFFSKTLKELLVFVTPTDLIRLQIFRLFVEILLWMLFIQNLLPVQMTFEGRNFDVLAGISAPLIVYAFAKNKVVMIVWNILCLGLLLNIVGTALLSMPTPLRVFMNEPAGTIVTTFPFIWLPALLVPLAYTLHFFSLKQLLTTPS